MTLKKGDLVVVTGSLTLPGVSEEESYIGLVSGEVGEVEEIEPGDNEGTAARVRGRLGAYWIDVEQLTRMEDLHEDPDIEWGEIRDYVYVEGDE